ncbi:RNA-guided endonuclease IscB [Deinococcus hopiensis]|uniref:RNA-guided endonuclease IscB n=1 Tax=Deinococcus hopiensis TaxID=309885 RepID=UPI001BB07163|nr:RNA-guided endonuclease IscB [Deinococcus hopiensis]
MPCTPKRARTLLEAGRAAVFRRAPFTIILKAETGRVSQPLALKIDPGSKTTGLALVLKGKTGKQCIWGTELAHRRPAIKPKLQARRSLRASRRNRTLRHRPARFLNRTRPTGWLPPSLMHRVLTTVSWARRLDRFTSLDSFSIELVSFDTQKLMNPDIQGQAYQKGTLFGTELRAYLLHLWDGKCAYCEKKGEEVEHLVPRSRAGSDRISNLVLSCRKCNELKGKRTLEEFLTKKLTLLKRIREQQQVSL